MNENVKTALGLGSGAFNMDNEIEQIIQIVWMFLAMSMFGYGIGNISSQLNFMNQSDLEAYSTKTQFQDIVEKHAVDPTLAKIIYKEIDTYYIS